MSRHKLSPFKTWLEVAEFSHLSIPLTSESVELTYASLRAFANWYVESTEARIDKALVTTARDNALVTIPAWKVDATTGEGGLLPFNLPAPFRAIPRQRKAYTQIVREMGLNKADFSKPRSSSCLVPLPAGEGKTAIAAMLINLIQSNAYFGQGMFPVDNIIYITPKRAKEKTRRFLVACGVKDVGIKVRVASYSELRTMGWKNKFREVIGVNPIDGAETITYAYTLAPFYPVLIIVDECHKIKKPGAKTSKLVAALMDGKATRVLLMSATAAVVPNDLYTFAVTSRKSWGNQPITKHNWKEIAWSVGRSDPKKPNGAAMERFADFFGDAIVKPPADARKIKCYNSVKLIEFANTKDRAHYDAAEQVYLEACERLGKLVNEKMNLLAMFTVYRAAEEYIKAPYFAELMIDSWTRGKAPICAVQYVATVKRVYEYLTKAINPATGQHFTRDDISIIWGGSKIIQATECYTMSQWTGMSHRIANAEDGIECLTAKERAKFRKTTVFLQDRWKNKESIEEQNARTAWLKETKLEAQNEFEQQSEVDRFQSGDTQFCLFTLAAGGTAIDLDQQLEHVRPRELFSTICYYLEEFVQAYGRDYRVSTISDVYNYAVFFKDTLVANHVAPLLAKKLASINKFSSTGVNLEDSLVNAAVSGKLKRELDEEGKRDLTIVSEQEDALDDGSEDEDEDEDDNK